MFASIKTHSKVAILGLALCTMAGVMAIAPTPPASAASAGPTIAVVGHVGTAYVNAPTPRAIAVHRLSLHITGSNFAPGSTVRLAIINTLRWQVIATGATQAARSTVICRHGFGICYLAHPRAGTIDYRVQLSSAPAASSLRVLYRSGGHGGMEGVALQ